MDTIDFNCGVGDGGNEGENVEEWTDMNQGEEKFSLY